ncbi:MAG: HisS family protein [Chloroflexota bacterium]
MKIQRCKGTRDLSPEEMRRFRIIEATFRDRCLRWGYQEVRTPTLEYLHLFTATGTLTPGRLNRVYSFLDWDGWSGERVVLRPDGTIPVARLYIDSLARQGTAKLFYVSNLFIFEETGQEPRERWQGGVELIGVGSPLADAGLVTLTLEVLEQLKISGVEVRLSHAGLIRELLSQLGLSAGEQARLFDQILDGDAEALARLPAARPEVRKALSLLVELKGKSSGFVKNLKALFCQSLAALEPHLDNFIAVVELLETLRCPYQIELASGRGFEYYTGMMFQVVRDGMVLGGGGRYDNLIPLMGGEATPASGFALYFDHIMNLLPPEMLAGRPGARVLIKAGAGQPETVAPVLRLARRLRDAGYIVELDPGGYQPAGRRWQLEWRRQPPAWLVTDVAKGQSVERPTADGVLAWLEGKGADKDSPA